MDILITTFSKRFNLLRDLLVDIRNQCENTIIICINGERDGKFVEKYRSDLLVLLSQTTNVYPIFFIETRGLSKLWNTGIIHSTSENVLVLNDDLIVGENFIKQCETFITSPEYDGLCMINGGFSSYIVSKEIINELNYFDERFLGFGWEDGDFAQRFKLKKGVKSSGFFTNQVSNISSNEIHDDIPTSWGKYTSFNKEFAQSKFEYYFMEYFNWGNQNFETEQQYPYEKFFNNKKNEIYF